ncbi:CrcB family protein [Synechococcus sp. AH-736-G21]|nr:CrcB family protein [Synechococcus sp. AH-736-G21]
MPETKPSLKLEMQELLLVGLGAVPGALVRWQVALHLGDQNLLVNVLGAALLGLLAGLPAAPRRQLLLGIGFCGSVTTFSSWMLAAMKHLSAGDWATALGLIGLTLGLGLGAAALGFSLGRWLKPPEPPQSPT